MSVTPFRSLQTILSSNRSRRHWQFPTLTIFCLGSITSLKSHRKHRSRSNSRTRRPETRRLRKSSSLSVESNRAYLCLGSLSASSSGGRTGGNRKYSCRSHPFHLGLTRIIPCLRPEKVRFRRAQLPKKAQLGSNSCWLRAPRKRKRLSIRFSTLKSQ